MSQKPIFQVTVNEAGMRLDNFILKQRRRMDKGTLYKLIRKGQVRLNGKRCKADNKVTAGDDVRVPPFIFFDEKPKAVIPASKQNSLRQRIVFENDDYVVVNKPAGLPCHVGTGHQYGVIEVMQSMAGFADLQLAHRLDVHTSGCLLLAKRRQALLAFQNAIKDQQVTKKYLAKLQGRLSKKSVVDVSLNTEHRVNGIRKVVPDAQGKEAETTFTPLKFDEQHTWVQCQIQHGRTHQIRAHAAHIELPVVGDTLYGASASQGKRAIYLHAQSLKFDDHHWQCNADF